MIGNELQVSCLKFLDLQFAGQQRNSTVATSSSDAEYITLFEAIREGVILLNLMGRMGEWVVGVIGW